MKAKINGVEIECEVEEFKELLPIIKNGKKKELAKKEQTNEENIEEEIKENIRPKTYVPARKKIQTQKIEENIGLIKENLHLSPEELAKMVGVNKQSFNNYMSRHYGGIMKLRGEAGMKPMGGPIITKKPRRKDYDYLRERMKYVSNRANQLMKQYNWSREKAYVQASTEWDNKKRGLGTIKSLPRMEKLSKGGNETFKDMLKHIAETKGVITYYYANNHLELSKGETWTNYLWEQFTAEFLTKASSYAKHLGVKNRYEVTGTGENKEIIYH